MLVQIGDNEPDSLSEIGFNDDAKLIPSTNLAETINLNRRNREGSPGSHGSAPASRDALNLSVRSCQQYDNSIAKGRPLRYDLNDM